MDNKLCHALFYLLQTTLNLLQLIILDIHSIAKLLNR
jgi:hypothetical protein